MTAPPEDRAAKVRMVARALDSAIGIPGTKIRLGIDSLVGLVPGVGDLAGAAFSGYIILSAARLGAPSTVLVRMLLNLGADTLVGTVPLLGDLFDVGYKANMRNAALLDQHLAAPATTRRASRLTVAAVVAGVLLLAAGAVAVAAMVFGLLAKAAR